MEDTRAHPVYRRVPVVESLGVAAYMGVAIRLDGHAIGSFCVVDTKPRRWSELDVEILSELALSAQREIQLRRQAREAVLQKDELDRAASERAAILDQLTAGVIVANPGGEITFVNGTAWKIYGLPPQEDLATFLDPLEFFTLEGAPVAREALPLFRAARHQETIGNAEFRVRCSNGREVITRGHAGPIYRQDGSLLGAVASFRDITAQREAEIALHESEEKFRQITENIQDIFWIFTPDFSETVYISPRYETLMQRPVAEVYERPLAFLESVLPEDQGTLLTAMEKLRHEGVSGVEVRVRLPDGSIRWHCTSGSPVRNVQGKVYRIVGISQDITEQKAAHEALRDRERYYRALIENASDLISIVREDGTMVYESPSAEQVVGWRPEEMLGRTMFELVHPEDLVRVQKDFQSALRNPHQRVMTSYRFRAGDGTWRQMESTGSNLLADPAVKGIVVHSRDVTARRESEARIRFQAQLLDTVGEAVIAVDLDGTVLFWNRFAEQLYGYSREEALGARLRELLPSDTGWNQTPQILQRLRAGEVWSGEFLVKRRDGSTFPTQVINSPIRDQSGQLVGIVGISSDLSERKQLEEQLRLSQRMEAIGRLAGGVAHDFNNILTVIKGECFMVLDGLSSMDPVRGGIEEIDRSADRAASLTRQLLAFSRKQVLRPQVIQPNRVVEGIEKMLHRLIGEDIELVTRLTPELDSVAVDPGQFEQVIMNLVVNARDAMPEGGVLIISTENRRVSESLQRSNYSI
ncbi:MAG: PAS domain S-box protein, partial [Verrucomicrobiota bacterium]|nr:PAS domain S-box protein [Verrucomicrobiota bacterium]